MEDVAMPYELTAVPDRFLLEGSEQSLVTLTAWFDFADGLLDAFAAELSDLTTGPSPVRCWPASCSLSLAFSVLSASCSSTGISTVVFILQD